MKPEINKLDYSSYRVPFIDEFVTGFEYEYVDLSISTPYKHSVGQTVKCKRGGDTGKILKIWGDKADIEIFK